MKKRNDRIQKFLENLGGSETNLVENGILLTSAPDAGAAAGDNGGDCKNSLPQNCNGVNGGNCQNYDGVCIKADNKLTCVNHPKNTNLSNACAGAIC